jgi:hypothetical protein
MSWICVCIVLIISPNSLSDMSYMDANRSDFRVFNPSSLSQDLMVSVILSTSQVRPSSTLVEDWYVGALGFLLDNSGRTLGLNLPSVKKDEMRASIDQKCPTNVSIVGTWSLVKIDEGRKEMSWHPSNEEIQDWIEAKEDDFSLMRDSRIKGECEAMERHISLLIRAWDFLCVISLYFAWMTKEASCYQFFGVVVGVSGLGSMPRLKNWKCWTISGPELLIYGLLE